MRIKASRFGGGWGTRYLFGGTSRKAVLRNCEMIYPFTNDPKWTHAYMIIQTLKNDESAVRGEEV